MRNACWAWLAIVAIWVSGCGTLTPSQVVHAPDSPEVAKILLNLQPGQCGPLDIQRDGEDKALEKRQRPGGSHGLDRRASG